MREFLDIIFKRLKSILGVMVVCVLLVVLANLLMTPVYQSETRVLIHVGREATLPVTAMNQPLLVSISQEQTINSHVQILQNRYLVAKALKEFDRVHPDIASPKGSGPQRALDYLRDIGVRRADNTHVIRITYDSPDPKLAQEFLKIYLDQYLLAASAHSSVSQQTVELFKDQAGMLSKKLRQAEQNLHKFRTEWSIYDVQAQKQSAAREMSRIEDELRQTDLDLSAINQKLGEYRDGASNRVESLIPFDMRSDPALVESLKNLARLKLRYNQLKAEYGKGHPQLRGAAEEIKRLSEDIGRDVMSILTARKAALDAKRQQLERRARQTTDRIQLLDGKVIEMGYLERQVDLLKKTYMEYAGREEASRFSVVIGGERGPEVSVVEPPTMPIKPVQPRWVFSLVLAAVIGLLIGFISAFAREYMAGTVNRPEEMAKLLDTELVISLPQSARLAEQSWSSRAGDSA